MVNQNVKVIINRQSFWNNIFTTLWYFVVFKLHFLADYAVVAYFHLIADDPKIFGLPLAGKQPE